MRCTLPQKVIIGHKGIKGQKNYEPVTEAVDYQSTCLLTPSIPTSHRILLR